MFVPARTQSEECDGRLCTAVVLRVLAKTELPLSPPFGFGTSIRYVALSSMLMSARGPNAVNTTSLAKPLDIFQLDTFELEIFQVVTGITVLVQKQKQAKAQTMTLTPNQSQPLTHVDVSTFRSSALTS